MEMEYKTDDINLASFLLTQKDINFVGVEKDRPGHFVFILSSPTKCNEMKSRYFNNFSVAVLDLFSKKDMLVSVVKQGN